MSNLFEQHTPEWVKNAIKTGDVVTVKVTDTTSVWVDTGESEVIPAECVQLLVFDAPVNANESDVPVTEFLTMRELLDAYNKQHGTNYPLPAR